MSVDEIGRAFSEQRDLREKIDLWRSHRAELAKRNAGPTPLASRVTMLFHVIPVSAFNRGVLRESWNIPPQERFKIYVPHGATNYRYNGDGFLATAQVGAEPVAFGYTQLFRFGSTEYADSQCYLQPFAGTKEMILGVDLERQMVKCYEDAITRLRNFGLSGGLYVGFSLIGIADKAFYSTPMRVATGRQDIIRDDIFTSPEVLVDIGESASYPYSATLLPLVDTMWQVAGLEGTPFKSGETWDPFRELR